MTLRSVLIATLVLALVPGADSLAARRPNKNVPPKRAPPGSSPSKSPPRTGRTERPAPKNRYQTLWTCSDGKGSILLFWLPGQGEWPAGGFRLERVSRGRQTLLADGMRPGRDARAMADLPAEDAAAIRELDGKIAAGTLSEEDKQRSISILGRSAAVDMAYGRALGVRYTDTTGGPGKRTYRVTFLDAGGNALNYLESNEVEPARRTPGPDSPPKLAAAVRGDGVALSWPDPPASATAPIVAYTVDRVGQNRRSSNLTPRPLVLNRHVAPDRPEFIDADAPRQAATYHVRSQDIFGRRSVPARARIGAAEFAGLETRPPNRPKDPDRTVAQTPPRPATPAAESVARAKHDDAASGAETWARLAGGRGEPGSGHSADPDPAPAPRNTPTPDERYPPTPVIVAIAGAQGKVTVTFRPGAPEDRTAEFLVFRSESPSGEGVPAGTPLPGDTRKWEDGNVRAGNNYWYRIVAVDKDGKRSDPAGPRWVRVAD